MAKKPKKVKAELVIVDPAALQPIEEAIDKYRSDDVDNAIGKGRRFAEAKELFDKDTKGFYEWARLRWDYRQTAIKGYIRIFDKLGHCPQLVERSDNVAVLGLLASDSTPEEARTRAKDRARKGLKVSVANAKEIIAACGGVVSTRKRAPRNQNGASANGDTSSVGRLAPKTGQIIEDEPEVDEPDPTIEETIDAHNKAIEAFCRRLVKMAEDECPVDEWLEHNGRKGAAIQKVKDACSALRGAKCHAKCPGCETGCDHCLQTGRVPKAIYDQMT